MPMAVTYIEIQTKIVHSLNECILSEIVDLAIEDLLLQGILFSHLQFLWNCRHDCITCGSHGRNFAADILYSLLRCCSSL